ncbi:MAG: hypothetical protein ACREAY_08715 [Nitrososphaera sp.]|uniref:hypothetical protein n=1 Tax=Nitrososphaera sp. TaxID=1971748 RepID=UPI003D6F8E57
MIIWYISAAAGAAFIIVALLFADIPYRMQDCKEVGMTGWVVCLPHKQGIFGGAETKECAIGFRGEDGKHFAISNIERFGEIPASSVHVRLSGTLAYGTAGPFEKDRYDTIAAIHVDSLTPL